MRYKTHEMNEIDKEVAHAYDRGVPVAIIAAVLKTSRGAIYRRINRHKKPENESQFYKKSKGRIEALRRERKLI